MKRQKISEKHQRSGFERQRTLITQPLCIFSVSTMYPLDEDTQHPLNEYLKRTSSNWSQTVTGHELTCSVDSSHRSLPKAVSKNPSPNCKSTVSKWSVHQLTQKQVNFAQMFPEVLDDVTRKLFPVADRLAATVSVCGEAEPARQTVCAENYYLIVVISLPLRL